MALLQNQLLYIPTADMVADGTNKAAWTTFNPPGLSAPPRMAELVALFFCCLLAVRWSDE